MAISREELLNDQEAAMRLMLDGRQSCIWTAMPGYVTSIAKLQSENTVEVQLTIKGSIEQEDGSFADVNYPKLIHVPLIFPSGGGFTITFPIAVNDEVLVIFASRAIDSWWQSGGIQQPVEDRMHDLSDGFAIPGPKSLPKKISAISTTAVQIRNNAGNAYVEIGAGGAIKLVSATSVTVEGDLNVTGDVIGNSATTPISLTLHTHLSATPGSPTGPPLP